MDDFFDYFQFAVMALIIAIFGGRTMYLRFRENVNPVTLGVGKKGIGRVVELLFAVGLTIWVVEVLLYSLDGGFRVFPSPLDKQLVDSTAVQIIGVVLVVSGFAIFVMALASFGSSWRVGIDEERPGELVTNGIFAVSRNPIFVFVDLYFIGTLLINGTLIFLLFALLALASLHYQILQEERFLTRAYGQAYEDYRARTGRYFGWRRLVRVSGISARSETSS